MEKSNGGFKYVSVRDNLGCFYFTTSEMPVHLQGLSPFFKIRYLMF